MDGPQRQADLARCLRQHGDRLIGRRVLAKSRIKLECKWRGYMRQVASLVKKLASDEEGAALIEYTVLLGILVVAVIATIVAVGGWVNNQWTALNAKLTLL